MTAKHPYMDYLVPRLEKPGVQILGIDQGRVHGKLRLRYGDRERFVTVPMSPSDSYRGAKNCLESIRHEFGLVNAVNTGPSKSTTKRKARKRAPARVADPVPITVGPDPFEKLREWRPAEPAQPIIEGTAISWRPHLIKTTGAQSWNLTGAIRSWLRRLLRR